MRTAESHGENWILTKTQTNWNLFPNIAKHKLSYEWLHKPYYGKLVSPCYHGSNNSILSFPTIGFNFWIATQGQHIASRYKPWSIRRWGMLCLGYMYVITYPFLYGGNVYSYLSIPKLQYNRWSLGMDKQFYPTPYWPCDYLSMLRLMLILVSKVGPGSPVTLYGDVFRYWSPLSHAFL